MTSVRAVVDEGKSGVLLFVMQLKGKQDLDFKPSKTAAVDVEKVSRQSRSGFGVTGVRHTDGRRETKTNIGVGRKLTI